MERPKILPTQATDEMFANVRYHLDGELVPMLTIELPPGGSVYFEHHVLLWKHPEVDIGIRPMQGALKRMMAGMQIFVTEARGPGQIAFSRDGAGHIVPIHLAAGQELHVREHQFLAATANVDYSFERVKGVANLLFGGTGFFIDKFHGHRGDGILWLHGYGNVFEKVLGPNESIDVEPGGWLYKDPGVRMETNMARLTTGVFGGFNLVLNLLARAYGFAGAPNLNVVAQNPLPAPQATLISALAQGVSGGSLDWKMIGIGALMGVALIIVDAVLRATKRGSLPPLAVGIGIYLPMSATFAVVIGAVIGHWYNQRALRSPDPARAERLGTLVASGMIVGESLFGVLNAGLIVALSNDAPIALVPETFAPANILGLVGFVLLVIALYRWMVKRAEGAPLAA